MCFRHEAREPVGTGRAGLGFAQQLEQVAIAVEDEAVGAEQQRRHLESIKESERSRLRSAGAGEQALQVGETRRHARYAWKASQRSCT